MREPLGPRIGVMLTRVLIPAWVTLGALFKLSQATPTNLPPKTILYLAGKAGFDLYYLLATVIGVEFLAVALMVCVARLARPVAIAILSVFCLVLIGEMVQGNVTSCGCMGNVKVPPWLMFSVDLTFLLSALIFDPEGALPPVPARWPAVVALLLGVAGFCLSFPIVLNARPRPMPPQTPAPAGANVNPNPAPLPDSGYWVTPSNLQVWVGQPWRAIPLFKFMKTWPRDLDHGKRYVVFYSRTCDHCQEMFETDLMDASLGSMVTAVEIPESATVMTSPRAWAMPRTDCELLSLPLGVTWVMTSPLTLRIVDGKVECAEEGGHRKCMELEE